MRKGRKVAKHCVFPLVCDPGRSRSRLAKAAGAEPSGKMRHEQLHALVAPSSKESQNAEDTACSGHFWKLKFSTSARGRGAKHILKPAMFKVAVLKRFWRLRCRKSDAAVKCKAHVEVNMVKAHQVRTIFGR